MLDKTLFVRLFFFLQKNAVRNKQPNLAPNPLNDFSWISSIGNTSNLKDIFGKVDKLGDLWTTGKADASLIRYITGLSKVSRQGKIFNIVPKKHTQHQDILIKKHLNLQLS